MTRVFISHSSNDSEVFVDRLASILHKCAIEVWHDTLKIKIGGNLGMIPGEIRKSDYYILVISPDSVNSDWVKIELSVAFIKEIEKQKIFILPVYFIPCEIPPQLRHKRFVDFSTDPKKGLEELLEFFNIPKRKINKMKLSW